VNAPPKVMPTAQDFAAVFTGFQLPTFLTTFDSGGEGGNLNQKNLL
jgi:hypothetical protein